MNQKVMCIFIQDVLKVTENYHINPIDELQVGARIEVGEKKQDSLDFALWKASKRR